MRESVLYSADKLSREDWFGDLSLMVLYTVFVSKDPARHCEMTTMILDDSGLSAVQNLLHPTAPKFECTTAIKAQLLRMDLLTM